MSRHKIQPEYNAEKVMKELINAVAESYEETVRNTNTGNAINTGNGYTEKRRWYTYAALNSACGSRYGRCMDSKKEK